MKKVISTDVVSIKDKYSIIVSCMYISWKKITKIPAHSQNAHPKMSIQVSV